MCISPVISIISPMHILYTPIQEINDIYCYNPMFPTKQSFSHNNHAVLHDYY